MRHPYVADVGDFGKYGLLRRLCPQEDTLRLGVIWYLTDAEEHNNDGKHVGYLKLQPGRRQDWYRNCDPELYDRLKGIRAHANLSVNQIERGGILSPAAVFYNKPTPCFSKGTPPLAERQERLERRQTWYAEAVAATASCDLVFTDPDNGIAFRAAETSTARPSHKHSYWHELTDLLENGKSVVAYHHFGRSVGHAEQMQAMLEKLTALAPSVWAIDYRRGTGRAFFVLAQERHKARLFERSRSFANDWQAHASLVTLERAPVAL